MTTRESVDVLELIQNKQFVKVCAPMVRYSKLQFRTLVRKYGCDLCYTPMILADSFCKSRKARNNEFTTNHCDSPLITQFAANTVHDFVGAAHLVSPFCDGVDLNCGCPQRWAKQQGLGCILLNKPESIYDIVRQCRNHINKSFSISVKLRILKNLRKTVEICQQLEHAGVSFIAVHGRTPDQQTGPVNYEALKLIKKNVNIPVIANGNIKSFDDCLTMRDNTGCDGVMVANGILTNPALFAGANITPLHCVQDWVDICFNSTLSGKTYSSLSEQLNERLVLSEDLNDSLTFQCFHHHLVFMLEKILNKKQRRIFNNLQSFEESCGFLYDNFGIKPRLFDVDLYNRISINDLGYNGRENVYNNLRPNIDNNKDFLFDYSSTGKFFNNKLDSECSWSHIFTEN